MSKQYFAKYLQIEEIPTFGDKYKHPLSDDIFTNTNNTSVNIDYSECKKVKLFLCSRDIQVGDKIRMETGEELICYKKFGSLYTKGKYELEVFKDRDFKVIGEISTPNIKEGQEFNRNQFAIIGTDSSKITCQIAEEDLKNGYHVLYVEIRSRW